MESKGSLSPNNMTSFQRKLNLFKSSNVESPINKQSSHLNNIEFPSPMNKNIILPKIKLDLFEVNVNECSPRSRKSGSFSSN